MIDHHYCVSNENENTFIKSEYQSCSTVVYELLLEEGYPVQENEKLRTALLYGLYMDTSSFQDLYRERDIQMRSALLGENPVFERLTKSSMTMEELMIAGDALQNHYFDPERCFAIVPAIHCEQAVLGIIGDLVIQVDVILANFTVTPERAEEVDFALPYMNVALGVISPDSNVITTLDNWNADDQMIVISGTTAETYLTKEYPDIPLQKYDSYATAKNALENGNGAAWANDNTEVIAFAKQNSGYTVGIPSLGSQDTIAPAVNKGNTTLLDWINDEIKSLGEESFIHKDYEETLVDTYGLDYEDELVVEGGETASSEAAASEAAASEVASSAAAQ